MNEITVLVGHYSVTWLESLHAWVVRDLQGHALDYRDRLDAAISAATGRANAEGDAYGT